jgi:hypothetical protein
MEQDKVIQLPSPKRPNTRPLKRARPAGVDFAPRLTEVFHKHVAPAIVSCLMDARPRGFVSTTGVDDHLLLTIFPDVSSAEDNRKVGSHVLLALAGTSVLRTEINWKTEPHLTAARFFWTKTIQTGLREGFTEDLWHTLTVFCEGDFCALKT